VAIGELTRELESAEADSLYHKNLLPVTYVTGDLAGAAESPVYAILRINEIVSQLTLPDGSRSRSTTPASRSTRRSTR
jgi:multidrug efflux pump subunit AcrB